jgi:hypothetical protein
VRPSIRKQSKVGRAGKCSGTFFHALSRDAVLTFCTIQICFLKLQGKAQKNVEKAASKFMSKK